MAWCNFGITINAVFSRQWFHETQMHHSLRLTTGGYDGHQFIHYYWFKEGFGGQLYFSSLEPPLLAIWCSSRTLMPSTSWSSGIKCCPFGKSSPWNMALVLLSRVNQKCVRSVFHLGLSLCLILHSPSAF